MSEQPFRSEDYPNGMVCATCDRPFVEGQPMNEELTALFVGNIPVVTVTCLSCASPSEATVRED